MSSSMPPPEPMVSPWKGRIVVLAGVIFVALNSRIMVAVVSPLSTLMSSDMPLEQTYAEIIGLAPPLCFALFGALSPALGRRFGLEAMMIAALTVSAFGEVGRALAVTPLEFVLWTIPSLAGAGMGNVICPPLIKKYFPDRLGMVTSIYTTFATISTALPPLFVYHIATTMGWRFSMGVWAILGPIGIIPWVAVLFSSDRAGQRLAAIKRRLDPRTTVERPPKLAHSLWKSPVAWAVMVTFSVNSIVGYTMFAWMPEMLRQAGHSDEKAAMYLAVFTLGSLPGALLTPMITARIKRVWILPILFFLGYLFGFLGLAIWPGRYTLAWMILTRLGDCFYPYSIAMINLRTRTTRGSIAMSGFVQAVGYTIAIIGPLGFGMLHSLSGGWHVPMAAFIAVLPIQMVAGLVAAKSKPVAV